MPELPEVQTTVSGLNTVLPGLFITDAWTDYGGVFHDGKKNIKDRAYFPLFKKEVTGRKFLRAERRGKNILLHLSGGKTILVHMKMTGHVMYGRYGFSAGKKNEWKALDPGVLQDPFNQFIHFVLTLSNGRHLVLSDVRKFAKVSVADTAGLLKHPDLAELGPEPLEENFGWKEMRMRLMRRLQWKAKAALLAQDLIAGIGNIYSDEILWMAGVHPLRLVKDISDGEFKKMHATMKKVLASGIEQGGDSLSDYRNAFGEKGGFQEFHQAYRRTGEKCLKPGCKGIMKRVRVGGRSAHFCPVHQQ